MQSPYTVDSICPDQFALLVQPVVLLGLGRLAKRSVRGSIQQVVLLTVTTNESIPNLGS
jgi:hypothetical protein